jgi:dipeptidyl aminopeptidase/acylaminoacyl peptidase
MLLPRLLQAGLLIVLAGVLCAWPGVFSDQAQAERHLAASFSDDGRFLASFTDCGLGVFDLQTGEAKRLEATSRGFDFTARVAFSPDGQHLVCASSTGLTVWDWRRGQSLFSLSGHNSAGYRIAVSPDGARVAAADGSSLRVWDMRTGELTLTIPLADMADPIDNRVRVAFSPDGQLIFAAGATTRPGGKKEHSIRLWTVPEGKEQGVLIGPEDDVRSLAVSPDGKTLALALSTQVRLWDIDGRNELGTADAVNCYVGAMAFSPDGKRLIVGGDRHVTVFDPARPQALKYYPLPTKDPSFAVNAVFPRADGGQFLAAAGDGTYTFDPGRGAAVPVQGGLTLRNWSPLVGIAVVLAAWLVLWTLAYRWVRRRRPLKSAAAERYAWLVVLTTAGVIAVAWAGLLLLLIAGSLGLAILTCVAMLALWLLALILLITTNIIFARGLAGIVCGAFCVLAILGELAYTVYLIVRTLSSV